MVSASFRPGRAIRSRGSRRDREPSRRTASLSNRGAKLGGKGASGNNDVKICLTCRSGSWSRERSCLTSFEHSYYSQDSKGKVLPNRLDKLASCHRAEHEVAPIQKLLPVPTGA